MAPFILSAFALCSPRLGARIVAADHAVLHAGGGVNGLLPVGSAGAGVGLGAADVSAQYDVHAGIVHVFSVGGRARLADGWAAGLVVSDGLFAIEQAGGLHFARAPFGSGLSAMPQALRSWTTSGGVVMSLSLGLHVKLVGLRESFGTVERAWAPEASDARAEIAAEWSGETGTTYLLFRAVVPIQAELRVLGYLPMVALGRTWGLP